MLSRGVAQRIRNANDPLLPFRQLSTLLKSTDFNFGNLETPVSGKDQVLGHDLIFNTRTQDIVAAAFEFCSPAGEGNRRPLR